MENLKLNREGNLISETHRQCTNKQCGKIFEKTSKTVTLCPECNSKRVKTGDPVRIMYRRAKNRAKLRNQEFTIEYSDIVIPKYCPILNIELEISSGKSGGNNNSPSLDRIDNSKGYIKGNIQVISQLANCMKNNSSTEEQILFAKYIKKLFPGQV